MYIKKLNYPDKETGIADLLAKGVYIEQTFEESTSLVYGTGVYAIVEIGKICINEPSEIVEPIYADGYHFDIMCEQEIDFGSNEIVVDHPKHTFAGY